VPDLSSLRIASWHKKAALVICDVVDDKTHKNVQFAPRSILRKQVDRCEKHDWKCLAASELEYYQYNTT
jgi:glutamine synthetase